MYWYHTGKVLVSHRKSSGFVVGFYLSIIRPVQYLQFSNKDIQGLMLEDSQLCAACKINLGLVAHILSLSHVLEFWLYMFNLKLVMDDWRLQSAQCQYKYQSDVGHQYQLEQNFGWKLIDQDCVPFQDIECSNIQAGYLIILYGCAKCWLMRIRLVVEDGKQCQLCMVTQKCIRI